MVQLDVYAAFVFVAIPRTYKVDRSAVNNQRWFPYECHDGVLNIVKPGAPLEHALLHGSDESYDGGKEVSHLLRKKL